MARKNKQARLESISGGYGAIPWTVLDSVSFKGASDKAKALLFALMRQHTGNNNGRLHLAKKWLYNQGWTCHENNSKARNELIERGLIVQTKWGGLNMGADLFALTWYDITNFVGLDITAKGYSRGAYLLCNLTPTPRRKPPVIKQNALTDDRTSPVPTTVLAKQSTGTTTVPKTALLDHFTGTTTENNVFIPLHTVNSVKRIVGVKAKSGIRKQPLS
ncbi:hypothetical protein [Methylotenera versatilis]|uniref:Uncharacterized protein n=1 Tax=Methylotenera versatilis (strain 301) TaxID=666681 RepID=D7DHK0_METV0|nr:hypothetical protein [Methylotenera versatilis]ADI29535.1 conserved hypothetical protein [Methylotenera versatilis 301]